MIDINKKIELKQIELYAETEPNKKAKLQKDLHKLRLKKQIEQLQNQVKNEN